MAKPIYHPLLIKIRIYQNHRNEKILPEINNTVFRDSHTRVTLHIGQPKKELFKEATSDKPTPSPGRNQPPFTRTPTTNTYNQLNHPKRDSSPYSQHPQQTNTNFSRDKTVTFSKRITCYNCQKPGHIARECWNQKKISQWQKQN